jgi:ubiquinone/menaquinone biosynthesis C-methylase UbiE
MRALTEPVGVIRPAEPVASRHGRDPGPLRGHANWYDGWAGADAGGFMSHAQAALAELLPPGPGNAVDVGCGTGLHAAVLAARRFRVLGLDYSADQLRVARDRLPVVRADGRALPLARK